MTFVQPPAPVRRPAREMPRITGLKLTPPGVDASIVNISTSGMLAESTARLMMGDSVEVAFEGAFSTATATGRVVRSQVAVMGTDGRLRYHVAIEFDEPLALDACAEGAEAPTSRAVRNRW